MIDSTTVAREKNCRLYPPLPAHEIIAKRNYLHIEQIAAIEDAVIEAKYRIESIKMGNGSEIKGITQKRIYEFMALLKDDPDKWFTIREMKEALGFKKAFAVTQPLDALLNRGLVIRRDIEFINPNDKQHPFEYRVKI